MTSLAPTLAQKSRPSRPQLPLNDQVYQKLRWALTVGDYRPGDRLSIRGLAAVLGTSAMPVREALKRLVSDRALEVSNNRSFRVPVMAPKRVSDLFLIRSTLEGLATEIAATVLTRSQVDDLIQMAAQLDQVISDNRAEDYLRGNYNFHFTIYTAAGNPDLVSIIDGLWVQTGPFLSDGVKQIGLTADWRLLHREIAAAIQIRDGARARQLIERDIGWGVRYFSDQIQEGPSVKRS
ncbi:MAG: GntR family transcriptional regulator [Pseudomonadota bacterium]